MKLTDVSITTDRLLLLPVSEKFTEDIFREFTPEITRFMFPKSPEKIEETLAYIKDAQKKLQSGEDLVVTILHKDTKEFLGGAGIHAINMRTPELGIWIKKSAHGHKYGKEAVAGLTNWARQNLRFDYLIYPVDRQNVPSRKIAESLGGVVTREMKKTNLAGIELDEVEYRIYP